MKTIRLTVEFIFEVPDSLNEENVQLADLFEGEEAIECLETRQGAELLEYVTTYVERD